MKAEDFETDCSITFLNFATAIDFFNDENLVAAYRQDMEKPLRDLWFTYAEGLMAGMHDGHHDSKEKLRMQIYQESLNKLDDDTGMLSDKDLNAVDSTNYQHYAPHQKEMLNATPGVHLRNGRIETSHQTGE